MEVYVNMTKTVDTSEKKMYSIREVADFLSVSIQTVKKLVESGRIKSVRVSDRLIRVSSDDLSKFIANNKDMN